MESAEAVAAKMSARRYVTMEITNLTSNYYLINPKIYKESGMVHIPPTPVIPPGSTEVCTFTKSTAKTTGAVGVLTYDLMEQRKNGYTESLAIMYSVPFDYNLYKNWFAVGIQNADVECNEKLYKQLYYDKDQRNFVREKANGSSITFEGAYLDIKATMCPLGTAIMKVEVWDKLFTAPKHQFN